MAVLPAFLAEIALYILPGFEDVRAAISGLPKARTATLLTVVAVVPWALATVPLGEFGFVLLAGVAAIAALVAFWYVALKPGLAADLTFLAIIAAAILSHAFRLLYPAPSPALPLEILGRLMLVHTGIIAVLCIRGLDAGFGFVPQPREWAIGLLFTLCFLPIGAGLGAALHVARWHPAVAVTWKLPLVAIARFAGVLWVVALTEEFFVRGFLQQILARSLKSDATGLVIASVAFGALHLPFGAFPNWRFATIAAIAGLFYGAAFIRTRGIRAPMVMHALIVTAWQLLFNAR